MYDEEFPSWGMYCYTKCYNNMEVVARVVRETEMHENAEKKVDESLKWTLLLKM